MKILSDRPRQPVAQFVFAHGAGAGSDSEFMQTITRLLLEQQIQVIRFNFPYMQKALESGKRRPPDRAPVLLDSFASVLAEQDCDLPLFIGGKSMGGRIASMILPESNALAAICLGYPFHPPGKPDKLRVDHLREPGKPILILQGERDPFGNREQVQGYGLAASNKVRYLLDGDHSFTPRKASSLSHEQQLGVAVNWMTEFIRGQI